MKLNPAALKTLRPTRLSTPGLQRCGFSGAAVITEKRSLSKLGSVHGCIPYNSLSSNLGGFYEVFAPGCWSDCLDSDDDFLVLGFHNPENVLGRRSTGTALFWDEVDGLHYEADLPDTQAARDLKALLERKDVSESSISFYIQEQKWEQRSVGKVRVVTKAKFVEMGPVSFAAYSEATAEVSREVAAALAAMGFTK